jgi:MtaA/CmuA family methyltransferase
MNSFERVFARMDGSQVDRIPNLCIVMQYAGDLYKVPYGRMVSDYRIFADAMCYCTELLHLDCLWAISDPMREAEGFGADVIIPENGVPYSRRPLIQDISDINKLKIIAPENGRRMNDRLQAVKVMSQRAAKTIPVIGWVEGAFAEACDLIGINEAMTAVIDEPEAMEDLLNTCLEQAKLFAISQIQAGADIIGIGDAAASLVSPNHYQQFVLPYQKKLIDFIKAKGVHAKLHICGNINRIFHLVVQSGANMIDCDHMVDLNTAAQKANDRNSCVCGNFDPVSILLQGTVNDVQIAVRNCAQIGYATNFIAAGCEVPRGTPLENMHAIYLTLSEISQS